jgi:proteasome lid subunit RPN8/RPN11
VGGILAGTWCIDQGSTRQFIIIEAALPARFTRHGSTFLTFTHESLVDMHSELEERFPGKQIVGWYHTHPGMGIFLSPYDTWLHDNFFPETWQVALVVEPVSMTGGFFSRQPDGNLRPTRYAGFYELAGSPGQSIVRMNNLWLGQETSAQKGVFI